jgi:hypothetical protein
MMSGQQQWGENICLICLHHHTIILPHELAPSQAPGTGDRLSYFSLFWQSYMLPLLWPVCSRLLNRNMCGQEMAPSHTIKSKFVSGANMLESWRPRKIAELGNCLSLLYLAINSFLIVQFAQDPVPQRGGGHSPPPLQEAYLFCD